MASYHFEDRSLEAQNQKLRALDESAFQTLVAESSLIASCRARCVLKDPVSTESQGEKRQGDKPHAAALIQEAMLLKFSAPPPEVGALLLPRTEYTEKKWPRGVDFTEETHKYNLVGLTFRGSATSIIHGAFTHFDEEAVSRTLALRSKPGSRYHGKTQEEILCLWEADRQKGTLLHLFGEAHLNGVATSEEELKGLPIEYHYFWECIKKEFPQRGWRIDATELILYDLESETVGMIDAVASYIGPDGLRKFVILDWKRTRSLSFRAYKGKKGRWPCHDIEDCNGGHYTLQLNLYPALLRLRRDIYVQEMYIGRFSPECDNYEMHKIPLQRRVVRTLLKTRHKNLCRLDHAAWLLALGDRERRPDQPGSSLGGEPGPKRQKKACQQEREGLLRLCTLWIRLAYRSSPSFWQSQDLDTLVQRTHASLLELLLLSEPDLLEEERVWTRLEGDWLAELSARARKGEKIKQALLWPLEESKQELGSVPLSTYFSSLDPGKEFSGSKAACQAQDRVGLRTVLLEIKRARPYLDHAGLCGTHEEEEFEELHFGATAFGLQKEQLIWHFFNVVVEKKAAVLKTSKGP